MGLVPQLSQGTLLYSSTQRETGPESRAETAVVPGSEVLDSAEMRWRWRKSIASKLISPEIVGSPPPPLVPGSAAEKAEAARPRTGRHRIGPIPVSAITSPLEISKSRGGR